MDCQSSNRLACWHLQSHSEFSHSIAVILCRPLRYLAELIGHEGQLNLGGIVLRRAICFQASRVEKRAHIAVGVWVMCLLTCLCVSLPPGSGSLLSHLKRAGWATGLAAGTSGDGMDCNTSFYKFDLDVTLTQSGIDAVQDVLDAIVSYIHTIRTVGPQEYFFRELQIVCDNGFRFKEDEEP